MVKKKGRTYLSGALFSILRGIFPASGSVKGLGERIGSLAVVVIILLGVY